MYRNVILDFISTNHLTLEQNLTTQMTLVLLPFEKNISSLFIGKEDVIIYHIKQPYTFEKIYHIDKLTETIIEFAMEYNNQVILTKDDFSYELLDPYYFKDMREFDFKSLEIIPIRDKDQLIGFSIVYYNIKEPSLKISNQKFLTLFNKLIMDIDDTYLNEVYNAIRENQKNLIVIRNNSFSGFFINNRLKEILGVNNNLIDKKHPSYHKIQQLITKMNKIEKETNQIYFIEESKIVLDTKDIEFLLLDNINSYNLTNEFAIIFVKDIENKLELKDLTLKFSDALNKIVPSQTVKYYKVNDNSFAVTINAPFKKKDERELQYYLKKQYFIVLNVPTDISLKHNFVTLIKFIDEQIPDSFDYNKYNEYLNTLNNAKFTCDNEYGLYSSELIKADNGVSLGIVVNGPIKNYYHHSIYKVFENALITQIERTIKNKIANPIFNITISSINRRKIWELLKKISSLYDNPKLIIHEPLINSLPTKEVFELLLKVKALGFVIIADSTLFMRFEYQECMDLIDAIIIRKEELEIPATSLINQMINNYYNEGKVVIFDKLEEDLNYPVNNLTCILVERK